MESSKSYLIEVDADITKNLYVIDGSNVAFEERNSKGKPKFSNILKIKNKLERCSDLNYKIICDRSLIYSIDNKENYIEFISKDIIIETPEGTKADPFILQYAFENNGYIISNDKFKDFYSIFKKKWIEKRRISFRIIDDEIYFDKLIIKEVINMGKSKMTSKAARRIQSHADKTGKNQDFKSRAQRAADKNKGK